MAKSSLYEPFEWQGLVPQPVVGVDEAGRGCLVGRVYAGAVILNLDHDYSMYTDSKKISESRREEIFEHILKHHQVGIGFATVSEIHQVNILKAALLAMKRAVESLKINMGHVIVDGNQKIIGLQSGLVQTTVVKGDLRAKPIAAASIIAKVSRDRYVRELAQSYPGYGFEKHKGYATEDHRNAIKALGPCPEHRQDFAGVKEFWA
jgi:ribonuclease HII